MIKNHFNNLTKAFITAVMLLSVSFLTGCEEDNPVNPTSEARMQFTHASPDAPNIDIYIGSSVVASNVAYLNTVSYLNITGDAISRVRINGAGTNTTIIDTSLFCQTGKSYSFIVFDSLQSLTPLFLTDDLTSPGSNSGARFIHLSPNGPTVDAGGIGKSNWFPFYSFTQYSSFRPVAPNDSYTLFANLAGTGTTIASVSNVDFSAGKLHTIILRGFSGGAGSQQLGLTVIPNN